MQRACKIRYLLHAKISVQPGDEHLSGPEMYTMSGRGGLGSYWNLLWQGIVVAGQPSDLTNCCADTRATAGSNEGWLNSAGCLNILFLIGTDVSTHFSFYRRHSLLNVGSFHPISHHFANLFIRSANPKHSFTLYTISP